MRVCDLMLKDLTSVDPDDSVRTLVETLETSEATSVPVTDDDDHLVGVVSERDVLAAALPRYMELLHSGAFLPNLDQLSRGLNRVADEPVSRLMSRNVISVCDTADDLQAADLLLRNRLRCLPVVDVDGRLVGIVRRVDLFKHVL